MGNSMVCQRFPIICAYVLPAICWLSSDLNSSSGR